MRPEDWIATSMDGEPWTWDPFNLDGDAVACDGTAIVCFPGRGGEFADPQFYNGQYAAKKITKDLEYAASVEVVPATSLKDLGLTDEHYTRLAEEPHLHLLIEERRIIFHVIDPEARVLQAYGVIYKGAAA